MRGIRPLFRGDGGAAGCGAAGGRKIKRHEAGAGRKFCGNQLKYQYPDRESSPYRSLPVFTLEFRYSVACTKLLVSITMKRDFEGKI